MQTVCESRGPRAGCRRFKPVATHLDLRPRRFQFVQKRVHAVLVHMRHVTSPPIGCRLTTGLRSPVCRCGVVHGADRAAFRGPRPCDPPGGGVKTATRSCWLTAGWTCACPSLPVEPLVKAHASGLAARGLCNSSSPGWAGSQEQSGQRDMRKEYARRHVHSSKFAVVSLHPTQLPQSAACARGLSLCRS